MQRNLKTVSLQYNMEKKIIEMSQTEYKRFLAFKEADRIVNSVKRSMREVREARSGNKTLKTARQLAYEL